MNPPRYGGFSFLLTLAIAAIVGVLAYSAGVQAGQTATAGASSVIVYGGGFGFFGFLLFILLIGLIFRAFARPRMPSGGPWMWGGRGWHGGHGAWQGGPDDAAKADLPPFVAEWHRRMHEQTDAPKDGPTTDKGA
jgi:hypothetical protein